MAGYLENLAQGLRLGGGVLNPQVQQFNQQEDVAATQAIRQRQQFMLAQAIRAAESGAADPAQVQQYLAQQGINIPEGFIGPDQQTKQRAEEMRREMAFRSEFDPSADVRTQLGIAMKHGKPEIAARIAQHAEQMGAQERQRLDALELKREQLDNQYQLGLKGLEDRKATADQMAAYKRWHDEMLATLKREQMQAEERWRRYAVDAKPAPAPSIQSIVDPSDSTRMISVDTRVYKPGTGLGSAGVIGVAGKNPSTEQERIRQEARVDTNTQRFAESLEKVKVPQIITSINRVNDLLKEYVEVDPKNEKSPYRIKKDIPGLGYGTTLPGAQFVMGERGNLNRAAIQATVNDLLNMYSGLAVTLPESQRRDLEMMASGKYGQQDFINAWPKTVEFLNSTIGNLKAGYGPEVLKNYDSRPGAIKLDTINPFNQRLQTKAPDGVSQKDWDAMTPDERKLWQN